VGARDYLVGFPLERFDDGAVFRTGDSRRLRGDESLVPEEAEACPHGVHEDAVAARFRGVGDDAKRPMIRLAFPRESESWR